MIRDFNVNFVAAKVEAIVKLAISNFRCCEFNFVDKSCNNAPLVLADLGCKILPLRFGYLIIL